MIEYDMPLFRPPSEGENLIIQATLGCSFNQCSFCSMYTTKQYQPRPLSDVFKDIHHAAQEWPEAHRVFLADGDALALPTEQLIDILKELSKQLPKLTRVSCYATPSNILHKSPEDLNRLKQHKLSLLYLGIETGSDLILKKVTKGASQRSIKEALNKAHDCKIKVSGTVILGLGGKAHWQDHIDGSIELLSNAPITYLSTLQLFLHETAIDNFKARFDEPFEAQNDQGILLEQARFIEGLEPPQSVIFRSNHASNALALAGNLPKDKARLLAQLQKAIDGKQPLRPEYMRGL
jgi:radical SAM superfamily enzyme